MRKLLLVKGPPGSGKSTIIRELGLDPYALSMDEIRQMRRSPELDSSGRLQISQEENESVFTEWSALAQRRLDRGEFLVLDAQFVEFPKNLIDYARKNRYEIAVLDLSSKPLLTCLEQNENRPEHKVVSRPLVEKSWRKMQNQEPLAFATTIVFDDQGQWREKFEAWRQVPIKNFDGAYEKIVHIGDLQGCLSVLTGPGGPFEHGFDDNTLYIFVGDFLDRGIENGEVLRWVVNEAYPRANVMWVWGNHEDHLQRWSVGDKAVSDEFAEKTLPQLLAAGLTPDDAKKVCDKAQEAIFYEFAGQKVMVTHAGLPTVPKHPELISLRQYSKGTGFWSDPIDDQFERNAPSGWVQVHGHRNHGWRDIHATSRSFNLEDQVEFGGRLRWCTLHQNGQWTTHSNKNKVYDLDNASKIERRKIKWINPGITLSAQTAATLRAHKGVKEKTMTNEPHIVSFNFTKDVFFDASWDDVVVKARGFFVNKNTNEIVARGYDKFFNVGERPETEMANLKNNLKFPVVGYVKENGFLGNIGYDAQTGDLFLSTKSSSSGDFSDWFRAILNNQMTQGQQEGLARWLRDNEACMTFEVIDPVNDPHMIDYDTPKMILLDVFHRSEHLERVPYQELQAIAKKFGFECKQRGVVLANAISFEKWFEKNAYDLNWRHHGFDVEGFVFEDGDGFMTKVKMANYAFWKKMRGQKDRIAREWDKVEEQGVRKNAMIDKNPLSKAPRWNIDDAKKEFVGQWAKKFANAHPAAKAFVTWCAAQDHHTWSLSIIDARKKFLATNPDPSIFSTPFRHEPEEKMPKPSPKAPGPR